MQIAALQKKTTTSPDSHTQKGSATLPAAPVYQQQPIQKMELEEEQPVQAKFATQLKVDITAAPPPSENSDNNNDGTTQLKELEEEMPLQGKFVVQKKELEEELPMQGKFIAQRMELEEEQPIQGKFIIQRKEFEKHVPIQPKFKIPSSAPTEPKTFQRFVLPKSNEPEAVQAPIQRFVLPTQPIQKKANNTGLPDNLKAGVENLSGFSMDDVKVHYNSAKPAQLQAHAYAQGTDIHIAPGQEKHLPHEAWHVVQQKQGRVQATMQTKGGVGVSDDKGLESEADVLGAKAFTIQRKEKTAIHNSGCGDANCSSQSIQMKSPDLIQRQEKANHSVISNKTLQLRVSLNRGRGGGFKSSNTGHSYKTFEEAEIQDNAHAPDSLRMQQQDRPQVNFEIQPPQQGVRVLPQTTISSALLQHPVHFGPIMTTGGDVTAGEVNDLAGSQVMPQDQQTAFSARNTHAMVLSRGLDGVNVHGHSGERTPLDRISFASHPVPQFYQDHVFRQGRPPEHVILPDGRARAHAEALAVNSRAFDSSIRRNAQEMTYISNLMGFVPQVGIGDESDAQFQNTLKAASAFPVSSIIAINRASCGHMGKSGHTGGCNQEMAEAGEDFCEMLTAYMDPNLAFLATETGMARFEVSASGPYRHQGNPALMTQSGVNVSMHNSLNWKTGQPKPISKKQQGYEASSKVDHERKVKRKRKPFVHRFHPYKKQDPPPPPPPSSQGISVS